FVDIGLEKAGFLHVSDFYDGVSALNTVAEVIGEEDVETEPISDNEFADAEMNPVDEAGANSNGDESAPRPSRGRRRGRGRRTQAPQRSRLPIEQQLRRGQDIIVQSAEERARLRADVGELRPPQGGFIVRTACEGVSRREIQRDVAFLTKLWSSILRKNESMPPASILYSDLDVALRIVRDLFSSEVDRLWCDDPTTYSRVVQFVQNYMPRLRARVTLQEGPTPLFDRFNIEPQIERALDRKVWLKSGGYLVFDQAEALTAIDVNTGRFVGKRSQDDTIFKTNLEAVEEVVKQLRLRNIGGIIIVDFIDMAREADRKKVSDAL